MKVIAVYPCFTSHNFCKCDRAEIQYVDVQKQMEREDLVHSCSHLDNLIGFILITLVRQTSDGSNRRQNIYMVNITLKII